MKILFIVPRLPLPSDSGAKIRTLNLLKNVAKYNQVSLLSFCHDADIVFSACSGDKFDGSGGAAKKDNSHEATAALKKLGIETYLVKTDDRLKPLKIFSTKPLSIEKYRTKEMEHRLKQLLADRKFDIVHFDHLHMGQYIDCVNGIPCVLDEHNVEAVILERCAAIEKNPVKRFLFQSQAQKMAKFEGDLASKFSKCLVVSENDKKNLCQLSGVEENIEVISNGVDTEYFSRRNSLLPDQSPEDAIVFTGSMDWLPNNDAAVYFCKDVLPLVWDKKNQVKFYVVGRNPTKELLMLAKQDSRIIVTGAVDDVRPYIAKAKVFVVPIRVGGGTRLKILEAMAMGKAVVSTFVGAEGIACEHGKNILLTDVPRDFSEYVQELLENTNMRDALGAAGRNLVSSNYDWGIIGKKLNIIYKNINV